MPLRSTFDVKADDLKDPSVHVHVHEGRACASFWLGEMLIQTSIDVPPTALASALENIAFQVRAEDLSARLREWRDAHPEQPSPLNHGGRCDSCGFEALTLFEHTSGAQVCQSCGEVDFTDEIYVIAPDEHHFDRRAEQHDEGRDAA